MRNPNANAELCSQQRLTPQLSDTQVQHTPCHHGSMHRAQGDVAGSPTPGPLRYNLEWGPGKTAPARNGDP